MTRGFATGADGNDTLISIENIDGSPFDDVLSGNAANNVLFGDAGNDTLNGNAGNDMIKGNSGIDTAVFTGSRNQYRIGSSTAEGVEIRDLVAGRDGNDLVQNTEFLRFSDKTLASPSSLNPIGVAIADQLSVVYFGRGISFDWRNLTATVVENGASPDILTAFFNAAVSDRAFGANDSLQTIVNKTFNNIFGSMRRHLKGMLGQPRLMPGRFRAKRFPGKCSTRTSARRMCPRPIRSGAKSDHRSERFHKRRARGQRTRTWQCRCACRRERARMAEADTQPE